MPKTFERFYDFSGGLNTRDAPHLIANNEVQEVYNFRFDPKGEITTRDGMSEQHMWPIEFGPKNPLFVSWCLCGENKSFFALSPPLRFEIMDGMFYA